MTSTRVGNLGGRPGDPVNPAGPAAVDPAAAREQAERVIADPLFRHSKRYSDLLRYIVDRTLEGKHDELKERIIGIEVFGRTPDYDTSLDPTVRVAASEVRKRLALYYNDAIHAQELRIDVPLRSYLAEFRVVEQQNVPLEAPPTPHRQKLSYWYIGVPVAVIVLVLSVWGIQRLLKPVPVIDKFWAPVLNSSGPVLVCVGSPPGETATSPQQTAPPGFAKPGMPLYEFSQQRVNVSMTDVTAANALSNFLRHKGKDTTVRPAYGTNLSDLRSSPAVLLGNFHNEWALRLGTDLRYRFVKESDHGLRWIEDARNPTNKNWSVNLSAPYEQVNSDYALITRVQDQTTGQWWIGIAGLTGLGTLTAHQLVMDPKGIEAIAASFPKGWEHKNLQIVLAIKVVQGSSGGSQVVAVYSW